MKSTILGLALVCSSSVFASQVDVSCTKLIDGNFSKNAYTNVKSINFNLLVDAEANNAEFKGSYVTKAGQYHYENESVGFFTGFYKTKFSVVNNVISATMHESSFWTCGSGGTPCHSWKMFSYNEKTKEGTLSESHSYSKLGSTQSVELSIKFICR